MSKTLKLSIIIPVYNEENHLPACLDSITKQTKKSFEVIVVDNNSTDKTTEIARRYDFVRLIHEKKQGLIAARNKGFEQANEDLLARIDADSVLDDKWVEQALAKFEDKEVVALTGPGKMFVDVHFSGLKSTLWTRLYHWGALANFRFNVLWGANMVIRRRIWEEIKQDASDKDYLLHEDQDLSILIKANGHNIEYSSNLIISTDGVRFMYLPKLFEYYRRGKNTLKIHQASGKLSDARCSGSQNIIISFLVRFLLIFPALLYCIIAGIYSSEKKLGLRS